MLFRMATRRCPNIPSTICETDRASGRCNVFQCSSSDEPVGLSITIFLDNVGGSGGKSRSRMGVAVDGSFLTNTLTAAVNNNKKHTNRCGKLSARAIHRNSFERYLRIYFPVRELTQFCCCYDSGAIWKRTFLSLFYYFPRGVRAPSRTVFELSCCVISSFRDIVHMHTRARA